jgi:hypothetical protein
MDDFQLCRPAVTFRGIPTRIGPTTAVWSRFTVHAAVGTYRANINVEVIDGKPIALSDDLTSTDPKFPLTSQVHRQLAGRYAALIEEAAAQFLITVDVRDGRKFRGHESGRDQVEELLDVTRSRRKVTHTLLEEVATVFLESGGSVKAVRAHFLVGERTAYRYVTLARSAGLIPAEEG